MADPSKIKPTRKPRRMLEPGPSDVQHFLSTGSTLLDLCISGLVDPSGRGGIPVGRYTEIFGPEASGKSYISGELLRSAQDLGWERHLVDTERSFEFDRAVDTFDLEVDDGKFHYYPSEREADIDAVEDIIGVYKVGTSRVARKGLINKIAERMDGKNPGVAIVDSIAALTSRMEKDGSDKRGQSRAKAFSQGMRQTTGLIADKKLAVVFDNQVRDVERLSGKSYDSPGGWAIKHYASVRIKFSYPSEIKTDDKKKVIGVKIGAKVVKDKIDIPLRSCVFTLLFQYGAGAGIDDLLDCASWLKGNSDILSSKQGIFELPGRKGVRGLSNFVSYVEKHDLEEKLVSLTRKEWIRQNVDSTQRKPRKRV